MARCALLLLGTAASASASTGGLRGSLSATRPRCYSAVEDWGDCTDSRCCSGVGFRCFQRDAWYAQCRDACVPEDGAWSCVELAPGEIPPEPVQQHSVAYKLSWKAEGLDFFAGFNFLTDDGNHGASDFVASMESAVQDGVVEAYSTHAILRAGRQSEYKFKRTTAKVATKQAWKHFLAVVRLNHVPWGCGVWPAIFTLGNGTDWPAGGEMDIMEYVNSQGSMTSFHTSQKCVLDPKEVNRYRRMPDSNQRQNDGSAYNCRTEYCENCTSLGCAPNALPLRTGEQWAKTPGAFAMQRAVNFTKIFFIPEAAMPADLESGSPDPDAWDAFLIAYYPFGLSPGCPAGDDVMGPQQLVFTLAFCGDWASKVWGESPVCRSTGPIFDAAATQSRSEVSIEASPPRCRAVDPLAEYAPAQDCCTQFIYDADGSYGASAYLQERAFFNISYVKVFTETAD